MDILNWVYLLKNKLVKTTVQDPTQDLVILGGNVTYAKRGDKYQSYGMTVQDFATSIGTEINSEMNYVQGIISPEVESDFIKISDVIVTAPGIGLISSYVPSSTGGSWTLGTYNNILVIGGSGYGAIIDITINGVGNYTVGFTNNGFGYVIGDVVTFNAGGTAFSITVDGILNTPAVTNSVYKLGGIAIFTTPGISAYSYLIGVISGDSNLKLINDASVIGAGGVTAFGGVSGKFAVNALVRDQSTGAAIPLTFATIVLDNTILGPDDYFVSIVVTAGTSWSGTAYIDIEFMSDQVLSYFN